MTFFIDIFLSISNFFYQVNNFLTDLLCLIKHRQYRGKDSDLLVNKSHLVFDRAPVLAPHFCRKTHADYIY